MLFTILGGIAFLCGGCISHGLAEFDFFLHSTLLPFSPFLLFPPPTSIYPSFVHPSFWFLQCWCVQCSDWLSSVTCSSLIGPPPPPGTAHLPEAPPIGHLAQRCGGATLLSPAAPHDVTDQLNFQFSFNKLILIQLNLLSDLWRDDSMQT